MCEGGSVNLFFIVEYAYAHTLEKDKSDDDKDPVACLSSASSGCDPERCTEYFK